MLWASMWENLSSGGSDKVIPKPACLATEAKLENWNFARSKNIYDTF